MNNTTKKLAAAGLALIILLSAAMPLLAATKKGTKKSASSDSSAAVSEPSESESSDSEPSAASPTPLYDVVAMAGSKISFACTAPYGATVKASFNGKSLTLKPNKTAKKGVDVRHSVVVTAPTPSSTKSYGKITYTVSSGGRTVKETSQGKLYLSGKSRRPTVRVKDISSIVYKSSSKRSDFVTTAKKGAVDYITEVKDGMYKLGGTGGWISQEVVQPLTSSGYKASFKNPSFGQGKDYERFTFPASGSPMLSSYQDENKLYLRFTNTSGPSKVSVGKSSLFSSSKVSHQDGDAIIELRRTDKTLWGYMVEYKDESVVLTCMYAPKLASGKLPLKGVTVAVDAGHGGKDVGARGSDGNSRRNEKDINLSTSLAVKDKLEDLGATVLLTRPNDKFVTLDGRMVAAQAKRVDFFLALHCNSVAAGGNRGANGVEVYYYENTAKPLASTMLKNIVSETGRANRGIHYNNFKVTLNTYAPSLLLEMGFISNQGECANLASKAGMNEMAEAIGDALIEYLK